MKSSNRKTRGFGRNPNSSTNSNKMSNTQTVDQSHDELIEKMMFTSHTMRIWCHLYHYMKMGGTFSDLQFLPWISKGVPMEYVSPPQVIEVMNNIHDFHEFRQKMITHLYKKYVEDCDGQDR